MQVSCSRWRAVAPAPTRTPERKVRTPQGSAPCESKGALNESSLRRKVSQKRDRFIGSPSDERSLRAVMREVRVKRRGKSPPPARKQGGMTNPVRCKTKQEARVACPVSQMRGQPPGNSRSLKAARHANCPSKINDRHSETLSGGGRTKSGLQPSSQRERGRKAPLPSRFYTRTKLHDRGPDFHPTVGVRLWAH